MDTSRHDRQPFIPREWPGGVEKEKQSFISWSDSTEQRLVIEALYDLRIIGSPNALPEAFQSITIHYAISCYAMPDTQILSSQCYFISVQLWVFSKISGFMYLQIFEQGFHISPQIRTNFGVLKIVKICVARVQSVPAAKAATKTRINTFYVN